MGVAKQLGLVLMKNLILRGRQPIILFFEIIWPLALFVVVALIRQGLPPEATTECAYNERSMPSAGVLPFMQSFVCGIKNKCQKPDEPNTYSQAGKRVQDLSKSIQPIISQNGDNGNIFDELQTAAKLIDAFKDTLEDPEIKKLIKMEFTIGDMFHDRDKVKKYLVEDAKVLTPDVADAILDASFNLTQLYEFTGYLNFKEIVCNEEKLLSYVVFRSSANITDIVKDLCQINTTQIPTIVDKLQRQIDVAKIMRLVGRVKEFNEDYTMARALQDVASMLDVLSSTNSMSELAKDMPQLLHLSKYFLKAIELLYTLPSRMDDLQVFSEIINEIEPLLGPVVNYTEWQALKQSIGMLYKTTREVDGTIPKPAQDLKFGDIMKNTMDRLSEVSQQTGVSTEDLIKLKDMKLRLDSEVVKNLIMGNVSKSMKHIYCVDPGLANLVSPEERFTATDIINRVKTIICQLETTQIDKWFTLKFDVAEHARQIIKAEELGKKFNWTRIILEGKEASAILGAVKGGFGKIIQGWNEIKSENVFKDLQQLFDLSGNSTFTALMKATSQGLDLMQTSLATEDMDQRWLIIYELILDLMIDTENALLDSSAYIIQLTQSDQGLMKMLAGILEDRQETTTALVQFITDPYVLKMLIDDPTKFTTMYCDQTTQLTQRLLQISSSADINRIQEFICSANFTVMIQKMQTDFGFVELGNKSIQLINMLEGRPVPEGMHANISSIFMKTFEFIERQRKPKKPASLMEVMKSMNKSFLNTEQFSQMLTKLKDGITSTSVGTYIKFVGPKKKKVPTATLR